MKQKIANLIKQSKNTIILTGAGMSTESGIPDFRSRTGLYSSNPEDILSTEYFKKHPKEFWGFLKQYLNWKDIKPNIGHEILADWEKRNLVRNIITQNIDGLHQKAGSKNVIQVHGTMQTATCHGCFKQYDMDFVINQQDSYKCVSCGQPFVRPDVVLFGDDVPLINTAINITKKADLMIVLGTSLVVYPIASIPQYLRTITPLVIINKSPTLYDNEAIVIHNGIGKTLTEINNLL